LGVLDLGVASEIGSVDVLNVLEWTVYCLDTLAVGFTAKGTVKSTATVTVKFNDSTVGFLDTLAVRFNDSRTRDTTVGDEINALNWRMTDTTATVLAETTLSA